MQDEDIQHKGSPRKVDMCPLPRGRGPLAADKNLTSTWAPVDGHTWLWYKELIQLALNHWEVIVRGPNGNLENAKILRPQEELDPDLYDC